MHAELENVLNYHDSVIGLLIYASKRSRAATNPGFLKEIQFPLIGEKIKKNDPQVIKILDGAKDAISEYSFIAMVASFEKIVFDKLGNTLGEIKKLVNYQLSSNVPFYNSRVHFIRKRKDVGTLSMIKVLLKGKIDGFLFERLSEIIDYRDRLAHGKKFGMEIDKSVSAFLKESAKVLDDIVNNI